jgi:hypothetical protein
VNGYVSAFVMLVVIAAIIYGFSWAAIRHRDRLGR